MSRAAHTMKKAKRRRLAVVESQDAGPGPLQQLVDEWLSPGWELRQRAKIAEAHERNRQAQIAQFDLEARFMLDAEQRGAAKVKGGRPRKKDHAVALATYLAARREGIGADGALYLAQKASGIRARSYVYELRKREGWDRVR